MRKRVTLPFLQDLVSEMLPWTREADIRGGIDVREVGREAHALYDRGGAIAADDRRTLAGGDGLVRVHPVTGDKCERSGTALPEGQSLHTGRRKPRQRTLFGRRTRVPAALSV